MHYRLALFGTLGVMALGLVAMVWPRSATPPTGIDAIRFDTTGWNRFDVSFSRMMWRNSDGDILELKLVPAFSGLGTDEDLESVRAEASRLALSKGGSLVSADVIPVAGRKATTVVYRREQLEGAQYVGMLFIRKEPDHFIFTLGSTERETAGGLGKVRAALDSLQKTITFATVK